MNKIEFRARQELKYKLGKIDRRNFIKSVLATGLTVPAALSLASRAEAAAPKKGGLFTMGIAHG